MEEGRLDQRFQLLLKDKGFNACRLWRLALQLEHAENLGIKIFNLSGFLNLYAFWKSNNFTIIPEKVDIHHYKNRLSITPDFCFQLTVELHKKSDKHCRLSHCKKRWVQLSRAGQPLNPDFESSKIFGDDDLVRRRELLGCTERSKTIWWVYTKTVD